MAYTDENTGREILIREIDQLAKQLGHSIELDPACTVHYTELLDLRNELDMELIQIHANIQLMKENYGQ